MVHIFPFIGLISGPCFPFIVFVVFFCYFLLSSGTTRFFQANKVSKNMFETKVLGR